MKISLNKNYVKTAFAGKRFIKSNIDLFSIIQYYFNNFNNNSYELTIELLNGLAEGSDIIAAEAFIQCERPFEKKLHAVLPMAVEQYMETIEDHRYMVRFQNLYQVADAHTILPKPNSTNPNAAYIAQSDFLAKEGDILLAVANLQDELKEGGTLDTIRKFKALDKPIYCFDLNTEQWVYINVKDNY